MSNERALITFCCILSWLFVQRKKTSADLTTSVIN